MYIIVHIIVKRITLCQTLCQGLSGFFSNAIVIRDPRCNDLSRPGFALAYNFTNNTVALVKIDNKWQIDYDAAREIEADGVKNMATFLDFIDNKINPYCREHNCDFNTYINNNFTSYYKKDCISIKSPTNPNQEIIYDEKSKLVHFLEVYKGSKPITDEAIKISEECNYLINKNNFAEFAKEIFEFCEENKCSFADYANKIFTNILTLKCGLNDYTRENPQEKLLYTVFDKDGKTAFTYYGNNTINVFKIINDRSFCVEMGELSNFINSNEEFKAFIKENKVFINRQFNEQLRRAQQQELNELMGAMGTFRGHYRKK